LSWVSIVHRTKQPYLLRDSTLAEDSETEKHLRRRRFTKTKEQGLGNI
jgi:hypothetical protein